ncbi:MAG: hypothetical protein GY710_03460 [Desulfobacteraceae bacterium]|nr:hypothetical protein [Desulfobacteraceae bacterium]
MSNQLYYSILTNKGLHKVSSALTHLTRVNISQMVLGDGNGSPTAPDPAQTSLVNQVYSKDLNQLIVDPHNPSNVIAEMIVPAADGGFTVREVGLYDSDKDLIAVASFPDTYKPVAQEGSVRDMVIKLYINVSRSESVVLIVNPAIATATQEYVGDTITDAIDKITHIRKGALTISNPDSVGHLTMSSYGTSPTPDNTDYAEIVFKGSDVHHGQRTGGSIVARSMDVALDSLKTTLVFKTTKDNSRQNIDRLCLNWSDLYPAADNGLILGTSSKRFSDIYASNGAIQTSDERLKSNIQNCALGLDFVNALRAVQYKWKKQEATVETRQVQKTQLVTRNQERKEIAMVEGKYVCRTVSVTEEVEEPVFEEHVLHDENGNPLIDSNGDKILHKIPVMEEREVEVAPEQSFQRTHFGLIAQEVKDVLDARNIDFKDFAPIIHDQESDRFGMRYTELISILIKAIQEMSARVEALENS